MLPQLLLARPFAEHVGCGMQAAAMLQLSNCIEFPVQAAIMTAAKWSMNECSLLLTPNAELRRCLCLQTPDQQLLLSEILHL